MGFLESMRNWEMPGNRYNRKKTVSEHAARLECCEPIKPGKTPHGITMKQQCPRTTTKFQTFFAMHHERLRDYRNSTTRKRCVTTTND